VDASVQITEIALQISLVRFPRDAVDAWRRSSLQLKSRIAQQLDVHMMQECRKPRSLIPPCGVTYAIQSE